MNRGSLGPDRLDRRSRLSACSTGKRVSPTERDLLWLRKLAEHGPLPSSFLLAFSRDTHHSEKRARERLTDLFHEDNTPDDGAYLIRPPHQFHTVDSRYNQLVYDLAPSAHRALARSGSSTQTTRRHAGPWLHSLMVACITASIELATLSRADITYIPQSAILARAEAELRCQVRCIDPASKCDIEKHLIPDALFGLEYLTETGSRFRFFAVEADRATEPATSANGNRKSFERNLLQYDAYVSGGAYRDHLKLTAPLLVLTVTSDARRAARMIDFIAGRYLGGNSFMLFHTWEDFGPVFRPPQPWPDFLLGPWARSELPGFEIAKP